MVARVRTVRVWGATRARVAGGAWRSPKPLAILRRGDGASAGGGGQTLSFPSILNVGARETTRGDAREGRTARFWGASDITPSLVEKSAYLRADIAMLTDVSACRCKWHARQKPLPRATWHSWRFAFEEETGKRSRNREIGRLQFSGVVSFVPSSPTPR